MHITEEQRRQYRKEGYFFLENAIPAEQVEGLREECQRYIDRYDAEMEAKGVTVQGINHYKKRYFISRRGLESPTITDFLFGELMADVCRATLGDNAFLFHEQYVVKFAEVGTKFGWHQDSGYVGHYHRPYLSCWCALDDMSIENGTVSVLPYSAIGMTPDDLYDHEIEAGSNDKIGYQGENPGVPALVPAGSIVVFSSRTFHRSGPNTTSRVRRCYLAQYSAEPIMNREGTDLWGQAIPIVQDGRSCGVPVQS
ncbi:MAG: phytanoyl-CoA dioxygenase family protein [Caldilineaceae bacterium SB0661_bin_32]|uniref:Phytanoyl-CoA dioxygenase family protein n=1 Tax=Caldilineaceae bacterium SB0661_bin_32 TaxID=2605255 RepID=A0A6B1D9U3_9CHLR|nr:phytanoyl-CoA dioxygenase family protein [Caldilineaceae bacterium SB0661_bin_32]